VLLDDRVPPPVRHRHPLSWLGVAMALAALAAAYQPLLHAIHELTEIVVLAVP
jgi:hypothetical protein